MFSDHFSRPSLHAAWVLAVVVASLAAQPIAVRADEPLPKGHYLLKGVKVEAVERTRENGRVNDHKSDKLTHWIRFDIRPEFDRLENSEQLPFRIVNPTVDDKSRLTLNKPIKFQGKDVPAGTNLLEFKKFDGARFNVSMPKLTPLALHSARIQSGFQIPADTYNVTFEWFTQDGAAFFDTVKVDIDVKALQEPKKKTPNIVLIMADDLGWKDLHCYGNDKLDTPHIDRLAEQGLLFTDAYSAAPVCTPTRAALMTGESPARLNITNHAGGHPPSFQKPGTDLVTPIWLRHLPLERVTLAEQLKGVGYATGFVGKWHLSSRAHAKSPTDKKSPTEEELRPEHQGFDINIGGCRFGGPPSYFSPYKIPNLKGKSDGEYLPDRCADECVDFIKSAKTDGAPFFLCWWNYSVHYPFHAPADLIAKYEKRKGPGIENPTYAAMIEGMDASIGKLLTSIDDQGLSEDTIVIFTSDNGPFAANVKPLRAEKGYLYEGGIRVPMIVRWPGRVKAATKTATPVVTMDIHATILEAANLKADDSNTPDGVSLLPMLKNESQLERDSIYFHYPNYAFHRGNRLGSAIRTGDYKLIKFYDDESVELYDLKKDISESKNLASEMPEKAKQLRVELESWLKNTNASQPQRAG